MSHSRSKIDRIECKWVSLYSGPKWDEEGLLNLILYVKIKNRNIHGNICKYLQNSKEKERYYIVFQVLAIKICQYILWIEIGKRMLRNKKKNMNICS